MAAFEGRFFSVGFCCWIATHLSRYESFGLTGGKKSEESGFRMMLAERAVGESGISCGACKQVWVGIEMVIVGGRAASEEFS